MPSRLTIDDHVAALDAAGQRLADLASATGFDVAVPTCPGWTVRDVVAHQTLVHRWSAANVAGSDPAAVPGHEVIAARHDLLEYFVEGLHLVSAALRAASDDLDAPVFLNDAPAPRAFWARRQAHETTVHMVDLMSASLGRPPTVDEVGLDAALAVDGVDELLCGFFTRGRCRLFDGEVYDIGVIATDAGEAWLMTVDERLGTCTVPVARASAAPVTVSGTAAGVYLSLWNRIDAVAVVGRDDLLARWRDVQQVRWR